jgi:hypothetical protein
LRSRLTLRQGERNEHPDANLLAAFAAQILPARERASLLEHLARCPECREVLATASTEVAKSPRIALWKWRWATAAAAACLLVALLWRPGSFQNVPAEKMPPAPAAPSALQNELEPKAGIAKPRIASTRRATAHPKELVAEARPELILRRTLALPPLKLDIPPPEPAAVSSETASLEVRQANNDFPQLSRPAQPEKRQQNRAGVMAPSGMFQSGLRASAAKSLARQTSQSDTGKSSLWNLDGTLRKSDDGGRTWSIVHVDDRVRLYALSAAGPQVWVGGASGALFHSMDSGVNWIPVVVSSAGGPLRDTITRIDIIRIEARNENWVKLKTRSGDWLTTDGGLHWQRE